MASSRGTIKALLSTEKSAAQEAQAKYFFLVAKDSSKLQIKKAVEEIYKVKVKRVNTLVAPGKLRRVRFQWGKTPDYKKAVVTLAFGGKIQVS
ncbi:MAG: 50S ribosomal protein L23 [Candidatus Omnitrophica bacterium]|nr:50S ribosomal protein L23 [Candidatus Omnitrophota bacterium]